MKEEVINPSLHSGGEGDGVAESEAPPPSVRGPRVDISVGGGANRPSANAAHDDLDASVVYGRSVAHVVNIHLERERPSRGDGPRGVRPVGQDETVTQPCHNAVHAATIHETLKYVLVE